jgi:hypothetical protein
MFSSLTSWCAHLSNSQSIPPLNLPSLFKSEFESDHLAVFIRVLGVSNGDDVVEVLRGLSGCERFSVALGFLDRKSRAGLKELKERSGDDNEVWKLYKV